MWRDRAADGITIARVLKPGLVSADVRNGVATADGDCYQGKFSGGVGCSHGFRFVLLHYSFVEKIVPESFLHLGRRPG